MSIIFLVNYNSEYLQKYTVMKSKGTHKKIEIGKFMRNNINW